jgi:peptidoglycan/xylan/chitin deacetylase (PgdA/CDA1 family)
MSEPLKRALVRLLTIRPLAAASASLNGGRATILMLHRFGNEFAEVEGFPPDAFRAILAYLRRHDYEILDMEQLLLRLRGEGPVLRRAVSFTLDDGYLDQYEVALPLLAEFDAPANIFLTTGFLDGAVWFWWDQVDYLFRQASTPTISVHFADTELQYDTSTVGSRGAAVGDFNERCKSVPDSVRVRAIRDLEQAVGAPLPHDPPPCYRPMTWEQARQAERKGVRFGPQTVSHPILSRVDDERSEQEITESWSRLKQEVSRPLPVFCYPNGLVSDFGRREIAVLERLGFLGALTCQPGYADRALLTRQPESCFQLPRFATPDYLPRLVQFVSGLERFKSGFRHGLAASLGWAMAALSGSPVSSVAGSPPAP